MRSPCGGRRERTGRPRGFRPAAPCSDRVAFLDPQPPHGPHLLVIRLACDGRQRHAPRPRPIAVCPDPELPGVAISVAAQRLAAAERPSAASSPSADGEPNAVRQVCTFRLAGVGNTPAGSKDAEFAALVRGGANDEVVLTRVVVGVDHVTARRADAAREHGQRSDTRQLVHELAVEHSGLAGLQARGDGEVSSE